MTEITTNTDTVINNRLSQWLFNPFTFVAGLKALLLGLIIILLSAFIGSLGNTHFDGVLDVYFHSETPPLWCFLAEGLIDWVCMAIPLFFFGLIMSRSSFRIIDILGTQALARWPYLITALAMLPNANRRFGVYLTSKFNQNGSVVTINYTDMLIFAFAIMVTITMAIWMVSLMYRAYCLSCNVKGQRAIITFIVSLVIAEVVSKFVILSLLVKFQPL